MNAKFDSQKCFEIALDYYESQVPMEKLAEKYGCKKAALRQAINRGTIFGNTMIKKYGNKTSYSILAKQYHTTVSAISLLMVKADRLLKEKVAKDTRRVNVIDYSA